MGVWREVCGGRYVGGVVLGYFTCVCAFRSARVLCFDILYLQLKELIHVYNVHMFI